MTASARVDLPEGCPPLHSYYMYLTGGCNLACRHCWLAPTFQPQGGTGGHLDYELFVRAVDEGIPLGLGAVKLTGGEPLLHPDLRRMVALLAERELSLTVETNGTLVTESLARFFKDAGNLGAVAVSLDGAEPETHDRFRGVKGSFDLATRGIRHLVEAGFRPQVIMSLHSANAGEVEALVRLAERLGAGSVKLNLIAPTGRGSLMSHRKDVLDVERTVELGRWVEHDLQARCSIPLLYSWPLAFYRLRRLLTARRPSCEIFNILGVLHTGVLAMCGIGVEVEELCYGQLGGDRVADVWTSSPALLALRARIPGELEGICAECIFRDWCLGTCVAHNYHSSGRLTAPCRFCTLADEAGLFPSSRRVLERAETHRSPLVRASRAGGPRAGVEEEPR